ncbi:hypothetical protein QZH41_001003 [Actinostola sp. cb2023]|nr:hypothetical protein QZH41_001003 [Actinostola sp. cb2023]
MEEVDSVELSETKGHVAMVNLLDDVSMLQESLETRLDVIERQIEVVEILIMDVFQYDCANQKRGLSCDVEFLKTFGCDAMNPLERVGQPTTTEPYNRFIVNPLERHEKPKISSTILGDEPARTGWSTRYNRTRYNRFIVNPLERHEKLKISSTILGDEPARTGWSTRYNRTRYNRFIVNPLERHEKLKISSTILGDEPARTGVEKEEITRPIGPVNVLIGYSYAGIHPQVEQKVEHLLLLKNQFGKCLGGSHPKLTDGDVQINHACAYAVSACSVNVEDFYKLENLGVECTPRCGSCKCGKCFLGTKYCTLQEERELKLIEQNLSFNSKENIWTAHYPWIKDPVNLPNNKVVAVKMLESTERRLLKNPEHAKVYQEQIQDMVKRNVARKLTTDDLNTYDGPVHYISHHAVLRPDSKSTPVRIVFNSSASYMGHALNDYWAKGPDLLNSLLGVLTRFRENDVVILGDIKKMYHSVKIGLVDQHTHRFLWRDLETNRDPDVYVIERVSFGDKPSGAIATLALRKTAEIGQEQYPQAAKTITDNTYMDDIIDSVSTQEEAKTLTKDIEELIKKGGFHIKCWTTSHVKNEKALIDPTSSSKEKVLGVLWNTIEDLLLFKIVQAMVQKESYGFNTFAGTRVGEIQEGTDRNDWYWVQGE